VDQTSNERRVQQVMDLLSREYYRPVDTSKLVNVGLQAAVASLHDPYSHYYPPRQYQSFLSQTNPQVSGIGVEVAGRPQGLEVEQVFPGSPAARAGLARGDLIIAVGAASLHGRNPAYASHLIKGRPGTRVTLTIRRGTRTRRLTIVRAHVTVPVAASRLLRYRGLRLGDLAFTSFTEGSAAELRTQVERMLGDHAQGLILDLRDNGGGLLAEAIKVASLFIPDGTIVTTKGRSQPTVNYTALGRPVAPRIPMVVLVDRGTASSAEIVTGALKDRGRAKVVGTNTYGKGVFQEIQNLPGGGALDITVGEYFTPNGQNLGGGGVREGRGIKPNVYAPDNPQDPGQRALRVGERVLAAEIR
jgi:carboxyl-terminal processing protease